MIAAITIVIILILVVFWMWIARDMTHDETLTKSERNRWMMIFMLINAIRISMVLVI